MNRLIACCIALILLTGSASAQWNVEYQQNPPESFNGVYFPSAPIGYVVGTGGAIYKTTDYGVSWTQQTSPTTLSLFDVFFKSDTEGWAVGDNGVIVYTIDGGANWILHPQSQVITTLDLNAIYFVGTTGWMGGDSEDIFKSTDNGATWALSAALGSNSEVEGISFVDANIGYAAVDGDMVAYTTDGGATFTLSAVNVGPAPYSRFDIEEIYTVDDTTAIATGWGSFVGLQPTLIIKTEDAGVTWNIVDTNYNWDIYTYGNGITMFDDGEMIIVGGGTGNAGLILHSTDMVNWSYSEPFTGEDLRDVMALPGTNTVVAVGDGGFIARSEDKGYTWSYIGTPSWGFAGWQKLIADGSKMYGVGGEGFIASLEPDGLGGWIIDTATLGIGNFASRLYDGAVFPEDGVVYICGSYGSLYKTTDFGDTWTMLTHSFASSDGYWGMHWFDKDNGVLVGELGGDDVIYTTDDGAATLTQVHYNVSSQQLNTVSFAPGSTLIGVAAGDNMGIFYTTDGGATWTAGTHDVVDTADDIEEVHMVSTTVGWGVGDDGTVIKTTDGGATWAQQPWWSATIELNDVYFSTPDFGWICGNDGEARYTNDGGATWNDISANALTGTNDINAIYMQGALGILWAGVDYHMLLSDDDPVVTDADAPAIPFTLHQNYPNPFNPATTIKFSIARKGFVSLNIYDVTGRIVAKVLNKDMDAGDHTVSFQANGLASGVYFYRLQTNDEIQTKKMILLR